MLVLIATAAVLGLLAYLLPQLLATRPISRDREDPAPERDMACEGARPHSFERVPAVEQRLCRCDVCDHAFVLSFERTLPADMRGDTTVCEVWVRCGRTSCRHVQPVLVPMGSWNHKTEEWLGPDDPASAHPNVRAILKALTDKANPRGRPTRG